MSTTRHSKTKKIGSNTIGAVVGSYIMPDDHRFFWSGQNLKDCECKEPIGEGWPGADFRYPLSVADTAVNIHVTGRTFQHRDTYRLVRVKIEWVGDCEPSTFSKGWMIVTDNEMLD